VYQNTKQQSLMLLKKAVKKGLKMQIYIEKLIEADEKGLIDWDKLGNQD